MTIKWRRCIQYKHVTFYIRVSLQMECMEVVTDVSHGERFHVNVLCQSIMRLDIKTTASYRLW